MALDVGALSLHATHQDLLWATQLLASSWHKWQAAAWEKKMDPGLHVTPGIGISVLPTVLKTSDTCCWRFWSHTALLYMI